MYILLLIYLIFILILSIKGYDKTKSDSSYFFSSFKTKTYQSYLSIVATETSVATILIFPSVGYNKNFNIIFLCLGYIIGRFIVALLYLKHYHKIPSLSLYEYISDDKGKRLLSFAYLLAKYISGSVRYYLAGYGLYQLTGLSIEFWLVFVLILIGVYSLTGGLKAVILTDVLQGMIILLSSILFFYFLDQNNLDLLVGLQTQIQFDPKISFFLLFGSILLTISSHGGDQDILQRLFSVAELKDAQRSLIISGFITSFVILIFVVIGYMLTNNQLDKNSPLLDFISKLDDSWNSLIIKNIFIVVLTAAAMSTLDSSIHSTGAIWKSILEFKKDYSNYFYSLISLCIMFLFSFIFIFLQTNKDFLSFALGSMNYINGTLFATVTLFVIHKKKLNRNSILIILVANLITTAICEYYSLYFALTTIISFFVSLILGWIFFIVLKNN